MATIYRGLQFITSPLRNLEIITEGIFRAKKLPVATWMDEKLLLLQCHRRIRTSDLLHSKTTGKESLTLTDEEAIESTI